VILRVGGLHASLESLGVGLGEWTEYDTCRVELLHLLHPSLPWAVPPPLSLLPTLRSSFWLASRAGSHHELHAQDPEGQGRRAR
jgi:hypothetical protein